jgi:hypothetical protein
MGPVKTVTFKVNVQYSVFLIKKLVFVIKSS